MKAGVLFDRSCIVLQVDNFDNTPKMRALANVNMIGIIHYNGYAGRSGEWANMKRAHVVEQLDAGKNFLVCEDARRKRVL